MWLGLMRGWVNIIVTYSCSGGENLDISATLILTTTTSTRLLEYSTLTIGSGREGMSPSYQF